MPHYNPYLSLFSKFLSPLIFCAWLPWACSQSVASPPVSEVSKVQAIQKGAVVAFPGAEGFGAAATGGRGGQVIKVTTLAASGPGSLAEALETKGPRIVVFDVSGVIQAAMLEIPYGDLTIAGQTAPGAGITIAGQLYAAYESGVDNIIIRHLRIRPPAFGGSKGQQFDALQFSLSKLLIFDHLSIAFGVDENVDLYEADRVTMQWCTIEESATQGHPEGKHNYGLIQGEDGYEISLHHNLFVHHKNRTPAVSNGPAEILNNVSYNVRQGFVHNNDASGHISIVGNTYRRGPSDDIFPFYFDYDSPGHNLSYYLADNYIDDPKHFVGLVDNPWSKPLVHPAFEYLEVEEDGSSIKFRSETPFDIAGEAESPHVKVQIQPAKEAYELVLKYAGAFPRDLITKRDVQETRDRSGKWGARIPKNLMSGLSADSPPLDKDKDGIPDEWEKVHGLNPEKSDDHSRLMPSGYTAIEEYINERADKIIGWEKKNTRKVDRDTNVVAPVRSSTALTKNSTTGFTFVDQAQHVPDEESSLLEIALLGGLGLGAVAGLFYLAKK